MRIDVPKLTERLEDFGAGWRAAAYIVTRKTTRRGPLSTLMLGLVALVTRIAARSRAIG